MTSGFGQARSSLAGCTIMISAEGAEGGPSFPAGFEELESLLGGLGADVRCVAGPRGRPATAAAWHHAVLLAGRGGVDAVLFLSSSVTWVRAAEEAGVLEAIRRRAMGGRLLLVATAPEEAGRLCAAGLAAVSAEDPTIAALAHRLLTHIGSAAVSLPTDAGWVEVRSGGVVVDDRFIPLTRGATGIIDALFLAGGRVLSRAELGRELPGRERSGRAVEVAVARLRDALDDVDLVQTVVKRGYRLAVVER